MKNVFLKKVHYLFPLIILFLFIGCAAKVSQMTTVQDISSIQGYKNASVVVQTDIPDVQKEEGFGETAQKLLMAIKQKLHEGKIFTSIVDPAESGRKIEISVNIHQLKVVGKSTRLLTGIGSGEAIMGGTIVLKDSENKNTIGIYSFIEKSGEKAGIFSDDTENQIDSVSQKVVILLKNKL
jgi:hypothetical protein